MKLLLLLLVSMLVAQTPFAEASSALLQSRQCILVITDSWTSSRALVSSFDRTDQGHWQQRDGPVDAVVGRAGLAWGRGEINPTGLVGPVKREGDDKAPAGVFRLGTAFGYATKPISTRMRYLPLSKNVVGVDDPRSRYYNRLVNVTRINHPDWKGAEKMLLSDQRYKWGIVVLHNEPPKPGAGSCIFLHVWLNSSTPTSGCTAMSEEAVRGLIAWLDPAKAPLLVQLPRSIYNDMRDQWGLPDL